VVDAEGAPKAAYHYCRRALAPLAVHLSDEGGNGLVVHVVNDGATPVVGELELSLWRDGEVSVGRAVRAYEVPSHGALEIAAASLLDGFVDLSYAYRFGPPPCDLVVARFAGAEAFHFPVGLPTARELDLGLAAELRRRDDGDLDLAIRTRRFAQSISLDFEGALPDDDFFHLAPGSERVVRIRPAHPEQGRAQRARVEGGTCSALNCSSVLTVKPP
jgi:beta-mannosidase